jgi:hypothetical protein
MRHLLIMISHGLTTEKCLNALNVFQMKSAILIYQTIWLIPLLWTWKISKNNRTQMMSCYNMPLNMQTDIRINALAQLMISYATLSQEIHITIGKLHYPKACCNQQLSGFHQVTGHLGSKRLFMQISSRYYHRLSKEQAKWHWLWLITRARVTFSTT